MDFSVLMSLYRKESPDYLALCLQSLSEQTVLPNEVVIVFDGPITTPLEDTVREWCSQLPIKILRLEKNVGLGPALNEGLRACSYEVIFRMDTDDVCHPLRFEKQIQLFSEDPKVSLVGTWVGEFDDTTEHIHALRKVPIEHDNIITYAKKRNPFNHMSVGYRKSSVILSGGYQNNYLYEDYALWVRMIKNGAVTKNLPEILVYARAGNGMEARRGGFKYAKSEVKAQHSFYKQGFLSRKELFMNLLLRVPVRLAPALLRKYVYRKMLR